MRASNTSVGVSGAEDSLRLYRTMLLIRHFEESVRRLAAAGETPGLVHLCSGQEATNVRVVLALAEGDYIASHHRGHGHCIAKGTPIDLLLAEMSTVEKAWRADLFVGFHSDDRRFVGAFQLTGPARVITAPERTYLAAVRVGHPMSEG